MERLSSRSRSSDWRHRKVVGGVKVRRGRGHVWRLRLSCHHVQDRIQWDPKGGKATVVCEACRPPLDPAARAQQRVGVPRS